MQAHGRLTAARSTLEHHDTRVARRDELELLRVERETAIGLRDDNRISDDILRELQQDADLSELRLHGHANESV